MDSRETRLRPMNRKSARSAGFSPHSDPGLQSGEAPEAGGKRGAKAGRFQRTPPSCPVPRGVELHPRLGGRRDEPLERTLAHRALPFERKSSQADPHSTGKHDIPYNEDRPGRCSSTLPKPPGSPKPAAPSQRVVRCLRSKGFVRGRTTGSCSWPKPRPRPTGSRSPCPRVHADRAPARRDARPANRSHRQGADRSPGPG